MTLRTVSPQASRVVRPTLASSRMTVGDLLQLDEVHLDVLAGGDVAPAPGVGLRQVGQHVELLGLEGAVGDLHPHHLVGAALALAVDAVVEAEDAEGVLVHLTRQVLGEQALELLDVGECGGADGARPDLDVDRLTHEPSGYQIPDCFDQQSAPRPGRGAGELASTMADHGGSGGSGQIGASTPSSAAAEAHTGPTQEATTGPLKAARSSSRARVAGDAEQVVDRGLGGEGDGVDVAGDGGVDQPLGRAGSSGRAHW